MFVDTIAPLDQINEAPLSHDLADRPNRATHSRRPPYGPSAPPTPAIFAQRRRRSPSSSSPIRQRTRASTEPSSIMSRSAAGHNRPTHIALPTSPGVGRSSNWSPPSTPTGGRASPSSPRSSFLPSFMNMRTRTRAATLTTAQRGAISASVEVENPLGGRAGGSSDAAGREGVVTRTVSTPVTGRMAHEPGNGEPDFLLRRSS